MNKALNWNEIEKQYDQQWVQLVDYDWPEDEPVPRSAKVRLSAPTRKEFNRLVLQSEPVDAARLFVGKHNMPHDFVISSNITKIVTCE